MPSGALAKAGASRRPVASIAPTVLSAVRPKAPRRFSSTGSRGDGPSSPDSESSTAGRPSAPIGPCSETVTGNARRTHCASARGPPESLWASRRNAACTVRSSPSGVGAEDAGQPTTHGLEIRVPAMSPSTSTPSTGPPAASRAHARAPAKPVVEPEVETSTSVFRSSRPLITRASSSIAAVPERSASPGPSRCESTTIRRSDSPGRVPVTVTRSPVLEGVTVRLTVNPARSPGSSGAFSTSPTKSASRASSIEPAVRFL